MKCVVRMPSNDAVFACMCKRERERQSILKYFLIWFKPYVVWKYILISFKHCIWLSTEKIYISSVGKFSPKLPGSSYVVRGNFRRPRWGTTCHFASYCVGGTLSERNARLGERDDGQDLQIRPYRGYDIFWIPFINSKSHLYNGRKLRHEIRGRRMKCCTLRHAVSPARPPCRRYLLYCLS